LATWVIDTLEGIFVLFDFRIVRSNIIFIHPGLSWLPVFSSGA
jgi:hypothetical protein